MADRYWVGGTASWDGTAGSKWSDTSGGAGGFSVPTSVDDVFFTNLSTGICTLAAGNTGAKSINCTGFTGTITGNTGLTVAGSVTLAAGMTFSPSATWTISGTGTITSAGKTFNAVRIDGAGITVSLGDNLLITNDLNVTQGTFDTTASNYSITASSIISSNSNTRTINLNGSTVTLTTTSTIINFSITTNLTFNAGTSQINLTATTTAGAGMTFAGGGLTYYNVSFANTGGGPSSGYTINGGNTFNALTFATRTALNTLVVNFGANQIIGTLTVNGTYTGRTFFTSTAFGTPRTLTVTTESVSYADFRDITIAGPGAPLTGTSIGDGGGNSGITFDTPKTVYWNLAGTQNWNATAWAPSSGGTPAVENFPLAQDTAIFDNAGAAGTVTLNYNNSGSVTSGIDASARTSAMTLSASGSNSVGIYGSLINGTGVTMSGTAAVYFHGRGTSTLTTAGATIPFQLFAYTVTGTVQLGDNLNCTNTFEVVSGTFNTNNNNLTCTSFNGGATNPRSIIFGTSTINLSGTGSVWTFGNGTGLTFSGASSTINLTSTSSSSRQFVGIGLAYGTLNIGGTTGISTVQISGTNTFNTISSTKTVAHTINFGSGTNTITNWTITGTSGNVVTVQSSTAGIQRTITYSGGQLNLDYMSFTDINFSYTLGAANPYLVYAGANSTNGGNNLGIAFIDGTTQRAYRLTTGTTWTVPGDWNSSNNNIYLIGGGGAGRASAADGDNRAAGGGGGGGGYTAITNFSTTAGSTINYAIGAGGTSGAGTNGGSTTWNSGATVAGGGSRGDATTTPFSSGGAGGTGDYAGGTGGAGAFGTAASTGYGSGGGGGAGGPNGVGGNGGNGFASTTSANIAGGGGGGNGGGTNGGNASSATGGAGGNNFSGVGGGATNSAVGTVGGGGAGGVTAASGSGGSGIDIQNTLGGAGGKGGAGNAAALDNAGLYGGGGPGGRLPTTGVTAGGFAGSQGVIFIVYTLGGAPASTPVILSGVTISGGVTIV